jgi:flagellin-like protein
MNKTLKKIKAVSPIVATIILIIITIIAGIIIYFYVAGFLAGGATNVSLKISGGATAPGGGTTVFVTLTIKNDGNIPIRLTLLRVMDPAVGSSATVVTAQGILNLSALFSGITPPFHALIGGGTITLSAGQSFTVEYTYTMSAPVAGFSTIVEVQGVNTVTSQTVGFLVTIAINPA